MISKGRMPLPESPFRVTADMLRNFRRRVDLLGEITEGRMFELQKEIATFADKRTGKFNPREPVVLWVTTESGGGISVALSFIGWVHVCRVPLVVVGYGEVSSAAAMILMASRHRYMIEDSSLYLHRGCPGVKEGMTIEEVDFARSGFFRSERLSEKYYRQAGAPLYRLKKLIKKGETLSVGEALELRLIDGVLTETGVIFKDEVVTKRRRGAKKAELTLIRSSR